jgi:hypothetical protein
MNVQKAEGTAAATANYAASEQKNIASQGKLAAAATLLTGAKEMISAGISYMAAQEYEQAAATLAATSATGAVFSPTMGALNPSSDNYSAGSTALNPGTAATAGTGAQASTSPAGNANLGTGINTGDPNSGGDAGMPPTPYTPGLPQAAAGAPGGANLGSTGTAAAPPEVDNSQPKAADNGRQGFGYQGGGAAYVAGGVAAEKGENLSGLLGQLLPAKKEEEQTKNGIMDFANRSPASEPYSLLGRNVNLFKRIEESMQSNWRRGTVGI